MTKQVFDFEPPKGFLNRNQLIQILKARAKPDDRMISLRLENNGREYDFMYELKSGRFQLHDREHIRDDIGSFYFCCLRRHRHPFAGIFIGESQKGLGCQIG